MVTNYLIQISAEDLGEIIKENVKEVLSSITNDLIPNSNENELLKRSQVSELLNVSVSTVDNYKRSGILPYSKIGNTVYFKKKDVLTSLTSIKY